MLINTDRIARRVCIMFIFVLGVLFVTGCDVHEFPEDEPDAEVILHLYFDEDMPIYREISYSREAAEAVPTYGDDDMAVDVRYVVEFYRAISDREYESKPTQRLVLTRELDYDLDYDIPVTVPRGRYRIIAWTDYVEVGSIDDKYYDTTLLNSSVTLIDSDRIGNTEERDAFRGVKELTITAATEDIELEMTRPLAKFTFIVTDFEEFVTRSRGENASVKSVSQSLEEGDFTIQIHYTGYLPVAYNLVQDYNVDSRPGLSFAQVIRPFKGRSSEVVLGYDYVFITPGGGAVTIQLVVYDHDGAEMTRTSQITVPLKQGHHTILRGTFSQSAGSGNDGLGISPEFIGPDYNYRI